MRSRKQEGGSRERQDEDKRAEDGEQSQIILDGHSMLTESRESRE
jgi:hypothetical protein